MKWAVYLMGLLHEIDKDTTRDICSRLELPPRLTAVFCEERIQAERTLFRLEGRIPSANSELFRGLKGFRTEVLLFMMAITRVDAVRRCISRFFLQLRDVAPAITGRDLQALGIAPGPVYRKILDAVVDEKLNGRLETSEEELAFVRNRWGGSISP
jgi:tRNA nucleotidyltransferase (CCA-adding enzyme)